jgi:hypothetical protein
MDMYMSEESNQNQLSPQSVDYITATIKGILGEVPFAGSLLVELAGTVFPNQRMDRIVKYARVLEHKLSSLQQDFVRSQLTNENFTDLLEEGMRQAARSLSDERREYIANLIANSLSEQDVEYVEAKHLLRMLSEINDIEVIWLRYHLVPGIRVDKEFREKHVHIIEPIIDRFTDPQIVHDKKAIQDSYKEHLAQLGLLDTKYDLDKETRTPRYDSGTGAPKIRGFQLSRLGRLLLRYIGFSEPVR